MKLEDDFYIGYETHVPRSIRNASVAVVVVFVLSTLFVAGVATMAQRRLPDTRFEYGQSRSYLGWLTHHPIPTLHVPGTSGTSRRYWLVATGKFGAAGELHGVSEGVIQLRGTLIAREGWHMLEIVPGSVSRSNTAIEPPAPHETSQQRVTLRGEVVDSKCYLGVMTPGEGAAHRDCAVRCLSGGVPPMFAYRDDDGRSHLAVLVRRGGTLVEDEWRRLAATRRVLEGVLVTSGDQEVLVIE